MAIEKTITYTVDGKEAIKEIDKISDAEKKAAKERETAANKQKEQQQQAINDMGLFGITVGGVKKNFQGLKATSKALFSTIGAGLKATGIGLFLVAIASLVSYFKSSKEAAEQLEVILATVGAAFTVLTERFAKFGGAILKIFKGDLKGAASDIKDTFVGIGAEIKADTKAMNELSKAAIRLRDSEREVNVELAERRAETSKLKLIAEDVTKSTDERLAAAELAFKLENELLDKRVANAEEALRIQQETMAVGNNTEEDLNKEAELRIALANIQEESAGKQLEINNKINTIRKEGKAITEAEKKAKEDEAILLQETTDKELELLRTSNLTKQEIELEAAEAKYTKLLDLANKYGQDTTQLTDKYNAEVLDINSKYAEKEAEIVELSEENKRSIVNAGVTAVIGALGEESKAAKALAVGQALINTYSAATAALAPPPVGAGPIFGPIAAGTAILSGLANVKKIVSTKLPGVTDTSPDLSSPDVPTTPQLNTSGGISGAIPNMDTIGPVSTAPVQAYVVENDISNAQALQEELEIQATL